MSETMSLKRTRGRDAAEDRADERSVSPSPTFGAAAARLRKLGYFPVAWPRSDARAALLSEHGVAVGNIGVLILAPIEDAELNVRVRRLLEERGFLSGPVRVGTDAVEVRPLKVGKLWHPGAALDDAVLLLEDQVVPMDGQWSRTLLETPADALPTISAADVPRVFEELNRLPSELLAERRPQPLPSRKAWISS